MKNDSVYGIATTQTQADGIVERLKSAGFLYDDISVLLPDLKSTHDFAHEKHTKAPEGAVTGASAGGVLGGSLGLLMGAGALAIPGLGPFIAAGPLMAALGGLGVGAAVGGVAGALVGMGMPELEAKRYEGKIQQGNILISVNAEGGERKRLAKKIFEDFGAQDVCVAALESVPARQRADRDHTGTPTPVDPNKFGGRTDVRTGSTTTTTSSTTPPPSSKF